MTQQLQLMQKSSAKLFVSPIQPMNLSELLHIL